MATTKITSSGGFGRAIDYVTKNGLTKADREKIAALPATKAEGIIPGFKEGARARILATNVLGDTPAEIAEQFEKAAKQKPNKKEPVHKVSINLKPGEHLETHQWLEVAHSYMQEMGYGNSPYLVVQHREKSHEHIHIVASKVDFNGKAVPEIFEKLNARKWANKIEERYGLSPTAEKASEKGLTRVEIEQALKTKKPPPKLILQESIRRTLEQNKETPDFLDALHKQNISIIVRNNEQKEVIGISYALDGRAFKGSSLGTDYTWKGLQEKG